MSAMTTTNWPDPTRPGVPLFPERDGWHMLDRDVWQWSAKRKAWNDTVLHPNFVLPKNMAWRKYYGPVFSPTQIKEMLAAQRERCAKACEAEQIPDFSMPEQWHNNGCKHSARAIRNLGDAP